MITCQIDTFMSEWREKVLLRIEALKNDKRRIQEMDARLRYQHNISESDTAIFMACVDLINKEIESLNFELMLDDMLASELTFEEYIKRFNQ